MKNSFGFLSSTIVMPQINVSKVFIVINLWIFMFIQVFVLVPVTAYAAPSATVLTITQGDMEYKDVDTYTTKVKVENTSSSNVNVIAIDGSSVLGNKTDTSKVNKTFKKGTNEFSVELKCGDVVTLTMKVANTTTKGQLNGPLCSVTNGDKEKPSRIGKDGKDVGDEIYKTFAYTAPTVWSNSTCDNPVGWQADTDNNDEFSNIYFVARDPKTVTTSADIGKNPYKYSKVACTSLVKQNYVTGEKDVVVPEVKNIKGEVTQKATTKKQKTVAKIDNTIVQNKDGNYVNKANDYTALFNKDPNKGWSFKNKTDTITVSDVNIGGKQLSKGKVTIVNTADINSITFEEILPNVDLTYTVNNEGIQKAIVIKNAKAFDNNLTTIEFTLKNGANSKIQKTTEKIKVDEKVAKAVPTAKVAVTEKTKDSTVTDLKAQAVAVENSKSLVNSEDQKIISIEAKELSDLAMKVASPAAEDLTVTQKKSIDTEVNRITEKPLTNDTIEISGNTASTDSVKLGTPETAITTKTGTVIKKESFSLKDGKLTILPDIQSLKETIDLKYPVLIDPNVNVTTASKDAYTASSDSGSWARRGGSYTMAVGTNQRFNIGANAQGVTQYTDMGSTRSYLRFEMPNDISKGSQITYAYMKVYVYDVYGGGADGYVTDYCGKDFNEYDITWNNQGDACGYINNPYPVLPTFKMDKINSWNDSVDLKNNLNTYGINNRYVTYAIFDSPGSYRGSIFCSKEPGSSICTGSSKGPKLQIEYNSAQPSVPDNWTDQTDYVGYCNAETGSGNCGLGTTLTVKASNFYDGNVPCNSYNVGVQLIDSSSWNTNGIAKESWNLGNIGGNCGGMNYFNIFRLNGTYQNYFTAWNGTSQWAPGWSWSRQYTIDNSAPVRIGALNTIVPFNKNGSVNVTMPDYADDSRDLVVIQNAQTNARLDGGGPYFAASNYNPDFNTTYPTTNYPGVINQNWVIESNGWIRDQADGKCLGVWDPANVIYATKNCTDANYLKWDYNPETKELVTRYNSQCLTQNGGTLNFNPCNGSTSQKWNLYRNGDVTYSNDSNKVKRYGVQAARDMNFTVDVRTDISISQTKTFSGLYEGMWYFRGFVYDRLGGANSSKNVFLGSSYVDNTKPEISQIKVESSNPRFAGDARISPNNNTSVNLADSLKISYIMKEVNPASAHAIIVDTNGNWLRVLTNELAGQNCTNGCLQNFVWDGKDTNGNFVVDQKLSVIAHAHDMTSRYLDIGTVNQWSNKQEALLGNTTVDNHGANISLSTANNTWTNNVNFPVKGGLAGYNNNADPKNGVEDRDIDANGAWYCIASTPNCNPTTNLPRDANFNFIIPTQLSVGANYLRIKSEDLAYNTRNAIGNPDQRAAARPDSQVDNYVINFDNTVPTVTVPVLTKVNSASGQGSDLTFTWYANDTVSGFSGSQAIWGQRFAMYEVANGTYTVAHTKYVNSFNCQRNDGLGASNNTMAFVCKVTVNGVNDGNYKFDACATDLATNDGCNTISSFSLKTKTYSQVYYPAEGQTFGDSFASFIGFGEKGGDVLISINGNTAKFNLDNANSGTYPTFSNSAIIDANRSKIYVDCNANYVYDHDVNPNTPQIQYCYYYVYLKNLVKANTANITLTKDNASILITRNYIFDPSKFNLALSGTNSYFSPNGDGKFDSIAFDVKASNNDGTSLTSIDKYRLDIKDANGVVISTQGGTGALPATLLFNGKTSSGAWLSDGSYTANLTVTRTILGITGDTPVSSQFYAKSNILASEKVTIMSPAANVVQIRGGFNISGQAPANWSVAVCISKVVSDPDNCVSNIDNDTYKFTGVASSMGYYTVVAEIPDTSTKDYFITAKATLPNTGTKTPLSDSVKTTVDLKSNILSIDMVGSPDGVSSDADIQALLAGTKQLSDIKGLVIKVRVTQNTEAIDINFGQYDNVNKDVPSVEYLNQRAGTINETGDGRLNFIPNKADILRNTTYTSFTQVKDYAAYQNKCIQQECLWTYTIPYPRLTAGGAYEMKFTSYKGRDVMGNLLSSVDTRGFVVNGQLPMRVDLMNVAKGTITTGINAVLAKFVDGIYYTNNLQNTFVIGGESTKTYTVNILNSANVVVATQSMTTNSNGFVTQAMSLPTTVVDGDYRVQVGGITIGTIRLDRVAPVLNTVKTSDITVYDPNLIPSVFPFVRSGANIKYEYTLNELTDENYMVGVNGYVNYSLPNGTNSFTNNLYLTSASNGRYSPVIYAKDYAGNMIDYGNDVNAINAIKSIVPTIVNAKVAVSSVITPQSVNYDPVQNANYNNLRNANKDFSVIVDNVNPDITSAFDKSAWYSNDGISADGVNPEVDRLKTISVADCQANKTCSFVIRGNSVTLKVRGEKFARGVFEYGLNSVPNQKQFVNPTSTNCVAQYMPVMAGDIVVKFGEVCDLTYTVTLSSDGSQYDTGEAKNYYQIDFYPVDNTGNIPTPVNGNYKSEIVVVYQDKTPTPNHSLTVSSGEVTNAYSTKVTDRGEQKSDVNYLVTNPKGIITDSRSQTFGSVTDINGTKTGDLKVINCYSVGCTPGTVTDPYGAETNFRLGTQTDDRTGCSSFYSDPISAVIISYGYCEDGVYTIQTRLYDTSGNATGWITKKITRDTVAPRIPNGYMSENNGIKLDVGGEPGASYFVNGNYGGVLNMFGMGSYTLMTNYEYSTTYTSTIYLVDQAGNKSTSKSFSVTTQAAPIRQHACSISTQGLSYPGATMYTKTSGFDPDRQIIVTPNGSTQKGHDGIDLGFPNATEVLASMDGTLTRYTDQFGGNGVIITSGNIQTIYWHLSSFKIPNNTQVKRDQVIGLSGKTGLATNYHLHFGVKVNGEAVDPETMLNCGPDKKVMTNDGTMATITPLGREMQTYCSFGDEYEMVDAECMRLFPNARLFNDKTSSLFDKWSLEDLNTYGSLPTGNRQWIYDQKIKALGEDFLKNKNEIIGKCVPYWVNEMITKGDAHTTIDLANYVKDNINSIQREEFWTMGTTLEVALVNIDKSKYKTEISSGTTNTINKIFEKCGANFLIYSEAQDKLTQEILDSQKLKITEWIDRTISDTAWYYTGYKYNPNLASRTPVITDDNVGLVVRGYNIDEVLSRQPVVDETRQWIMGVSIIADSLTFYFSTPICVAAGTATAGVATSPCYSAFVGGVNGAINFAGEYVVSQRSGRPMDYTAATVSTAIGFMLGPLGGLAKRGITSALKGIVSRTAIKIAGEEMIIVGEVATGKAVGSAVNLTTKEVVGKIENGVLKDSLGQTLAEYEVKSTGQVVKRSTGEVLGEIIDEGGQTIMKTIFKKSQLYKAIESETYKAVKNKVTSKLIEIGRNDIVKNPELFDIIMHIVGGNLEDTPVGRVSSGLHFESDLIDNAVTKVGETYKQNTLKYYGDIGVKESYVTIEGMAKAGKGTSTLFSNTKFEDMVSITEEAYNAASKLKASSQWVKLSETSPWSIDIKTKSGIRMTVFKDDAGVLKSVFPNYSEIMRSDRPMFDSITNLLIPKI